MSTLAYFTIPKALNTNPRYKTLSVEAKYLYGYMRDLYQLSHKNRWKDKTGTYIKMARTTMATLLNRSLPTIRKILAQLVQCGLIIERRMGLTLCNHIYVQLLPGETPLPSAENPAFTPDRKPSPMNNPNPTKPYNYSPKTVLAQRYTQREYTAEELDALFEVM